MKTYTRILIGILFSTFTYHLPAQVLVQGKEGTSSILYQGGTLGFDITQSEINFDLLMDKQLGPSRANKFLYGVSASGRNSSGIVSLFNKGDLSPKSEISATLGLKIQSKVRNNNLIKQSEYDMKLLQKQIKTIEKQIDNNYSTAVVEALDSISSVYSNTSHPDYRAVKAFWGDHCPSIFDGILNDLKPIFAEIKSPNNLDNRTILGVLKKQQEEFKSKAKKANGMAVCYKNLASLYKDILDDLAKEDIVNLYKIYNINQKIEDLQNQIISQNKQDKLPVTITPYITGGIFARSFQHYTGTDTTSLINSFQKEYFRGGFLTGGINFQRKKWILGVASTWIQSDNFTALSAGSFNLKNEQVVGTQTLTTSSDITAYSGSYNDSLNLIKLNIDFVIHQNLKLGKNFIAWNLYLRHNNFINNDEASINSTNLGIGAFFFNTSSKKRDFLGGIYLEAPDLRNNIEKAKEDPNLRPLNKRLSFGLVAKWSFISLSDLN